MSAYRLYVDGASRNNPGPSGAGAVLKNPDGSTAAELWEYLGVATNNIAEYRALLLGLRGALERKIQDLEVFTDSELMAKQINLEYAIKNPGIRELAQQAFQLKSGFRTFRIQHIPREQNKEADKLSVKAIREAQLRGEADA